MLKTKMRLKKPTNNCLVYVCLASDKYIDASHRTFNVCTVGLVS